MIAPTHNRAETLHSARLIRTNSRHAVCGFTLLEVLAAVAVAAIGLGGLISLYLNIIRMTERSHIQMLASTIAEHHLYDVILTPNNPSQVSGMEQMQGREFLWNVQISSNSILDSLPENVHDSDIPHSIKLPEPVENEASHHGQMYRADIDVQWTEGGNIQHLNLSRIYRKHILP